MRTDMEILDAAFLEWRESKLRSPGGYDGKPMDAFFAGATRGMAMGKAQEQAKQRWIHVGERLPDEAVEVLAYSQRAGRRVAAMYNGRWHWDFRGEPYEPTHWAPLLGPPGSGSSS